MRYVVQNKSRPPTFTMFVNDRELFQKNILKFIRNSLIDEFDLKGVPVKVFIKEREEIQHLNFHRDVRE